MIATAAAGNSLLRVGLSSGQALTTFSPLAYLREFASVEVVVGVLVLVLGFILQLTLLSWADLTYALPLTSSSYVVITVVAAVALHERVSVAHWSGVLLILAGVVCVARTKPLTTGSPPR